MGTGSKLEEKLRRVTDLQKEYVLRGKPVGIALLVEDFAATHYRRFNKITLGPRGLHTDF